MSRVIVKCKCCGDPFSARSADIKRGWAKFCSKSCKAIKQTQRTGIGAGGRSHRENSQMSIEELSYGGYGDSDWNTPFGDGKW